MLPSNLRSAILTILQFSMDPLPTEESREWNRVEAHRLYKCALQLYKNARAAHQVYKSQYKEAVERYRAYQKLKPTAKPADTRSPRPTTTDPAIAPKKRKFKQKQGGKESSNENKEEKKKKKA